MKRCPTCHKEFADQVMDCPFDASLLELITAVSRKPSDHQSQTFASDATWGHHGIRPGMVLQSRYQVDSELGRGGFSAVYLARDRQLHSKPVVIKFLLAEPAENQYLKMKFRQEAEALTRISHPGVVSVLDYGETPDGGLYMVMELVEGVSLRSVMKPEGMDFDRVARIMQQICKALGAAHDKGVIHCDPKPENIMLQDLGDGIEYVKILDFGIAKIKDSQVTTTSDDGIVAGTPRYMAPEQLEGNPSRATDIYILGIVAYEMITGRRPFNPSSSSHYAGFMADYEAKRTGVKVKPRDLRPDLPEAAQAAILKALAYDPQERYAHVRDFGDELARALIEEPFITGMRVRSVADAPSAVLNEESSFASGAMFTRPIVPVLAIEIVDHALFPQAEQAEILDQLRALVESASEYEQRQTDDRIEIREAASGLTVIFFDSSIDPLQCAVEIARAVKDDSDLALRMGIHKGSVYLRAPGARTADPGGNGIVVAQQIMGCGDAGHILVSNVIADSLSELDEWSPYLRDLGQQEIAPGRHLRLFNFYTDEVGNATPPTRFRANMARIAPAEDKRSAALAVGSPPDAEVSLADHAEGSGWGDMSTLVVFGLEPGISALPAPVAEPASIDTPTEPNTVYPADGGGDLFGANRSRVLPVGAILTCRTGMYQVEGYLEIDHFASVYQVREIGAFQEELAVKVIFIDERADSVRSLLKPWRMLSLETPDSFVRLLGVDQFSVDGADFDSTGAVAIFMEYLGGQSLAAMVKRKWKGYPRTREQLAQLMRLFLQACHALALLHEKGLVHGHIKPANLLLNATETRCKLSDFGLLDGKGSGKIENVFRCQEMPEATGRNGVERYSIAADIYALGVTLYHLLSGQYPDPAVSQRDKNLTKLNPLVSSELNQVVLRCLENNPKHRTQRVDDLLNDLTLIGVAEAGANTAPLSLARLLLDHLNKDDLDYLAKSLEKGGFRSLRADSAQRQADLIEEYCYTASPREVLGQNCPSRQLAALAQALSLKYDETLSREDLITRLLETIGFLSGPRQVFGIETTLSYLQGRLLELANATTSEECLGLVHSSLAAVERVIGLLMRFYGQLIYASGVDSFLSRCANHKDAYRMTFGEKIGALRALCLKRPRLPLPDRVKEAFDWPIISATIFEQMNELVAARNQLAHEVDLGGFHWAQSLGRQVLSSAVEILTKLAENKFIPRVVQIVSRQDDVYGRHFYMGHDDRGHSERIFTPLPLDVGQLYLFYPLTNPARINPLIFPYDSTKRRGATSGGERKGSRAKGA